MTGVEIVYMYFQIPLMILVIAPAIDGLRREWREASANLGASSFQYWRYVGVPVLMPSLLGRDGPALRQRLLRLRDGVRAHRRRVNLVPIRSASTSSGNVLRQSAPRQALAFGMIVVIVADDARLHPAPAARLEVGAMKKRDLALGCVVARIGAVYFLIPLLAMLIFSLRSGTTGKCCTSANYSEISTTPSSGGRSGSPSSSRSRRSSSPRAARPDRLLGAPEAAAAAAADRVPRARAVRGSADHPRRRAARPLQGHATAGSSRSRTASSSRPT